MNSVIQGFYIFENIYDILEVNHSNVETLHPKIKKLVVLYFKYNPNEFYFPNVR